RDRVYARGRRLGVGVMYPTPVHEINALRPRFVSQRFPVAKTIAERLLTLPTHHLVTQADHRTICAVVERENAAGSRER
ncbi:MAG: DegT/DnrJ/EryC1/StrS family aminotransferase, partial [Candidatus Rokuibacteriota bacterium]